MWYEILPSALIVGAAFMVPQAFAYYSNQWIFGNPMRRDLSNTWDIKMFRRDFKYYDPKNPTAGGLENIPSD